jgi:hypothetical protein
MEQQQQFQGVLWKRRDVFKNKWRPRWFILQEEEAVLTYYLLSKSDAAATSTISTPLRRSNTTGGATNINVNANGNAAGDRSIHSTVSDITNATVAAGTTTPVRTTTNTQQQSVPTSSTTAPPPSVTMATVALDNPVDYDVVPRGAIYLLGCQVFSNDNLSRPEEGLFAFTISPPPTSVDNAFHLAARTEADRTAWVRILSESCSGRRRRRGGGGLQASSSTEGDGEASGEDSEGDAEDDHLSSSWKSLSSHNVLFDNVPSPLAAKLDQSLETYLELCDDDHENSSGTSWTPIFQDRDGVSAFTRQDLHGRTMMKSTAIINHHPKQVLNLLVDSSRRPNFETKVALSERLEVLNPHTFLDYYAYKAVWPTLSRDFAVVLHWQALHRRQRQQRQTTADQNGSNGTEKGMEQAIVTLAFSCPEANQLKEPDESHIRAHLFASFCLLKLLPPLSDNDPSATSSGAKCHVTRILSYDLGGKLPRNLTNTVLMQQAGLPGILSNHLQEVEPNPPERLSTTTSATVTSSSEEENGELPLFTNEEIIRDVVDHIVQQDDTTLLSSARRRLSFDKNAMAGASDHHDGSSSSSDDGVEDNATTHKTKQEQKQQYSELSLAMTASILFLPLFIYKLAAVALGEDSTQLFTSTSQVPGSMVWWFLHPACFFCATALGAVRYVVLRSLGNPVYLSASGFLLMDQQSGIGGPSSFRFSVDLKGVLRFIAMKKEERKELAAASQQNQAEISLLHIVAIALSRAMKNHAKCWNYRRVNLPLLGIDGYYTYPSSKLDLSVSSASGRVVTLENFCYDNVQAVANALADAEQDLDRENHQSWMSILVDGLGKVAPWGDFASKRRCGQCLIVLTHTNSEDDDQRSSATDSVGVEFSPGRLPEGLDVLVVVGGVRLLKSSSGAPQPLARAPPPKPILSLSLTVNNTSILDIGKCHTFAEEVQKLVQFPELCDD